MLSFLYFVHKSKCCCHQCEMNETALLPLSISRRITRSGFPLHILDALVRQLADLCTTLLPPPCGEHILRHYAAVFSFSNSMGCRGRQLRIIFLTNKASNSAKCNTEWSRTQNAISLQSLSKRKAVSTLRGLPLFALEHLISSICSKGQNTRNKFKTDFQHGRWLVQALLASIFVTSRTM